MATCLTPGKEINGYTIEATLNKGAFADAYRAVTSSGKKVFFKQYKSPSCRVPWYNRYVEYQQELKHRVEEGKLANLTYKFLDFFESRDSGQMAFYQVFEFVTGGCDLRVHLDSPLITWSQRIIFAKLLMSCMRSFHAANIIHTDLKPENLYLIPNPEIATGYNFKVIDFDQAIFSDKMAPWDKRHPDSGDFSRPYAGTPGYMSPEHLNGTTPQKVSDVFTCGIILYELLSQEGNPYLCDDEEYKEQVMGYEAPKPTLIDSFGAPEQDAAVRDILWRSLDPDPDKRPSAEEFHTILIGKKAITKPIRELPRNLSRSRNPPRVRNPPRPQSNL